MSPSSAMKEFTISSQSKFCLFLSVAPSVCLTCCFTVWMGNTFWVVSYTSCYPCRASLEVTKLIHDSETSPTSKEDIQGMNLIHGLPGGPLSRICACKQSEMGSGIKGMFLQRLFQDFSKSCTHCCTTWTTLKESNKNGGTCSSAQFSS